MSDLVGNPNCLFSHAQAHIENNNAVRAASRDTVQ